MSDLEFVTNTPDQPDIGYLDMSGGAAEYRQWRSQFLRGAPRATEAMTVGELLRAGMVGLYRRPPTPSTSATTAADER